MRSLSLSLSLSLSPVRAGPSVKRVPPVAIFRLVFEKGQLFWFPRALARVPVRLSPPSRSADAIFSAHAHQNRRVLVYFPCSTDSRLELPLGCVSKQSEVGIQKRITAGYGGAYIRCIPQPSTVSLLLLLLTVRPIRCAPPLSFDALCRDAAGGLVPLAPEVRERPFSH